MINYLKTLSLSHTYTHIYIYIYLMRQELKDDFDGLKISDYGLPQQGEEEEEAVKSNVSRKSSITKSISKLKSFKGIKVM